MSDREGKANFDVSTLYVKFDEGKYLPESVVNEIIEKTENSKHMIERIFELKEDKYINFTISQQNIHPGTNYLIGTAHCQFGTKRQIFGLVAD